MGTISWGWGGDSHPSCAPTWPAVLGRGRTTQLGAATGLRSGSKSQGPDFYFVVKYVSHEMYHHSRVRTCNSVAVGTRHSVEHHFCVVKSLAQGKRWNQKSHSLSSLPRPLDTRSFPCPWGRAAPGRFRGGARTVRGLLCSAAFTQHGLLKVHLCCWLYRCLIPFYG